MRTVTMLVLSGIMFIFHVMLSPVIEIFNAKIDFILISVVMLALFSQKWYPSLICSVYSGLAIDITTQANTYVNTGMYLFFGVFFGILFLFLKQKNFLFTGIIVFAAEAFKHLVFVFLLYIMRFSENMTLATFLYGLPSALYTFVASMGIFFVYKWIFSLPFMEEKTEDSGKYIF